MIKYSEPWGEFRITNESTGVDYSRDWYKPVEDTSEITTVLTKSQYKKFTSVFGRLNKNFRKHGPSYPVLKIEPLHCSWEEFKWNKPNNNE